MRRSAERRLTGFRVEMAKTHSLRFLHGWCIERISTGTANTPGRRVFPTQYLKQISGVDTPASYNTECDAPSVLPRGLLFEIVFAPGSERRESYPLLVEYMNKTRTNPKMDRAALRQAADSTDGRSYILAGLQTSKNDCLGTEHFSGDNSAFDWTVIGHRKMFRTDPYPAVGADRNSNSVRSRIDGRPPIIDAKTGCFCVGGLNLRF